MERRQIDIEQLYKRRRKISKLKVLTSNKRRQKLCGDMDYEIRTHRYIYQKKSICSQI